MYLGKYEPLRAMLDEEFGGHVYTDDNEVCNPDGNPHPRFEGDTTIAFLTVVGRNAVRIDYLDGQSPNVVTVEGARP